MSNKQKSTNKPQFLTSENYIRQKSKTLQIAECFINPDWQSCKMCQVVVTRKHVTGNVTACIYLVDLLLLGVKDTMYKFNVSPQEIRELLDRNGSSFIEIPYELAHNIIFAAVAFAQEYGFMPHKEFTSITGHFLEEDNDDVPLIEIECGMNGKPCYTNTGFDNPAREREILAQLERTAGAGNYDYILPGRYDMYQPDDDF